MAVSMGNLQRQVDSEVKEGRRQKNIPDQGDCLRQGLEEVKNNVMFGVGEDLQTVQCSQGTELQARRRSWRVGSKARLARVGNGSFILQDNGYLGYASRNT